MAIRRQVVLHNTQGNHNKYYEISVKDQMNSKGDLLHPPQYFVECRWGRIENFKDGNPQSQVKVSSVSFGTAVNWLGDLMYEKQKKGYKVVKDTASGQKATEPISKSQTKRVAAQKDLPTFDRTEHVEVVVSDWWTNDNIEERAI